MSQGQFERSKYETDANKIVNVQIQPETLTLTLNATANDPPAGTVEASMPSAKVSGGKRQIGINCRMVRIQFTGAPPTGYDDRGTIALPILTPATYNAISRGSTGTYTVGGTPQAVVCVGKTAEALN